jgi:hypothetical protein
MLGDKYITRTKEENASSLKLLNAASLQSAVVRRPEGGMARSCSRATLTLTSAGRRRRRANE